MIYSVNHDSKDGMILAEVHGEIDFKLLKDCAKTVMGIAQQIHCPFVLTDMRKAQINTSAIEISIFLKELSGIVSGHGFTIHTLKRAFVTKPADQKFDFYENVCHNYGHNAKRFYDVLAARNWLLTRNSAE
ncbi:MAG: hypothetical protein JNM55_13090 [Anaerolineales bacterium]|nr:hypothetical protein [Anaerolineales bacterium]